ncbi:MAG: HupE / UreJ protein [Salinivirgaceae bacterium]|nr:MAG: HupE / UreJ protein [Salinivirgaceae bacterium]
MFGTYFSLGVDHIANLRGYDHIIFLIVLCATYSFNSWKKLLILVTAFTIGHSLTLALATLNLINVNSQLIEVLIPVTILVTAFINLIKPGEKTFGRLKYAFALFFGLIHGLGFSNYLRMLLSSESDITIPLLGFNLGVEVGQLLIVLCILAITWLILGFTKIKTRDLIMLLSGIGIGTSIIMIIDRL